MIETQQTNKLISRDQYAITDDTEAILNEILTEMTKKINMVVLTEFAQRGVRHLEVKILRKTYEFFFEEDGFKANFDLEDPVFGFILFEMYEGAKETTLFGEKMNFVIEPDEVLKNLRANKLVDYFKLMSKIVSVETVLSRMIEEIVLNLNYVEQSHKDIVIGNSNVKNRIHEITFSQSANMEKMLEQLYQVKQLAIEIVTPTGTTEVSEEAKQYVDKLLAFLRDSEDVEAEALKQLSMVNISKGIFSIFEKKTEKTKEYKTNLKLNQEKISEELSKVNSYESGQKAFINITKMIIEENPGLTGAELEEAYFYIFNLVQPGGGDRMENHIKQIENKPDGIIKICGECESKEYCAALNLLQEKNKLDFPHIM